MCTHDSQGGGDLGQAGGVVPDAHHGIESVLARVGDAEVVALILGGTGDDERDGVVGLHAHTPHTHTQREREEEERKDEGVE